MALEATFLLSAGDGATADHLDLNNDAGVYTIAWWDPGQPFDGRRRNGSRRVVLGLNIEAANVTALWGHVSDIEEKLRQARLATANPQGGHSGVTLGVKIGASSTMVYFDVLDGSLTIPQEAASGITLEQGGMYYSQRTRGPVLELECLPYARGDAVALSGSPFTINKANLFSFYQASIPGDVPALVEYEITDNSTGVVLNKILIAHKSQPDLDSGDWDPVVNVAASGSGTNTGTFANAIGDDYAGTTTLNANTNWTELATATPATPYADQAGEYDVWARVFENTNWIRPVRNLEVVGIDTAGSLPTGVYQIVVTTRTPSQSLPSNIVVVRLTGSGDEIDLSWDAPHGSSPADYYVFYKRDTADWKAKSVGSSATTYTLSTESGAVTLDPPTESALLPIQWRGRVSMSSGGTVLTGMPQSAYIGISNWSFVKLLSGIHLPPTALEEGGSVEQWQIVVEALNQQIGANNEARIDALWIMPSDSVVEAEYLGLDLATARKWVVGRTRHGNAHGVLRSTADDSEQGQVSVSNPPMLGPGDTQVAILPLVAEGIWDVSTITLSVAVTVTPRFAWLKGS